MAVASHEFPCTLLLTDGRRRTVLRNLLQSNSRSDCFLSFASGLFPIIVSWALDSAKSVAKVYAYCEVKKEMHLSSVKVPKQSVAGGGSYLASIELPLSTRISRRRPACIVLGT